MPSITYEQVQRVISLPPDRRKDFEVNDLLPWFRKKSELFKNLKTKLLFDLIKNLQFSTKSQDSIIIKQGEQGDCMYIVLRGKVTIYINYAVKAESETKVETVGGDGGGTKASDDVSFGIKKEKENIRQQLGTFVTQLGAGATFGEVALMSEDCVRTASIIADESSDLIVIDRELYNRSVKAVLKAEFEDKSNFIASNPYFKTWAAKYKKQLAMALQKESFSYEGVLAKQGAKVEAIYYILVGEVKVTMDPLQHPVQYTKLSYGKSGNNIDGTTLQDEEQNNTLGSERTSTNGVKSELNGGPSLRRTAPTKRLQPIEVCLLGVNEPIGDIEILMGLNTYMQTATCTQRTEVLVLELKHYERLLVKRNRRTIDGMRDDLELRLRSRAPSYHMSHIPLLSYLQMRSSRENEAARLKEQHRQQINTATTTTTTVRPSGKTGVDEMNAGRGLLVDINGPGTVFHKIRLDYERLHPDNDRQRQRLDKIGVITRNNDLDIYPPEGTDPQLASPSGVPGGSISFAYFPDQDKDPEDKETSDMALSLLEDRLRGWLTHESRINPDFTKSSGTPRVAKLHRVQSEVEQVKKPGTKILMRLKQNTASSQYKENHRPDNEKLRTSSELDYYKMALNAPVPKFVAS